MFYSTPLKENTLIFKTKCLNSDSSPKLKNCGFSRHNFIKLTIIYIIILLAIIAIVDHGGSSVMNFIGKLVHTIPLGDKIGHFLLMGLLSFAVNLSLDGKKFRLFRFPVLIGSFCVFIVVTLEEYSQIFVDTRTFDGGDLIADYLGIFLFGQLAWYLSYRKSIIE